MKLKLSLIAFLSLIYFFINAQKTQSRSAKTGRFVTKSFADKHKSTTITNKVKLNKFKK